MTKKVLITPRGAYLIRNLYKDNLRKDFDYIFSKAIVEKKGKLKKLLSNMTAVIIGSEEIDKEIIDQASRLKCIVRFGGSLTNIDVEYANIKNITVHEVKLRSISKDVSLLAIGLFLSYLYNFKNYLINSQMGLWHRDVNPSSSMRIGIIGSGNVAKETASTLISLGYKVNYWGRKSKLSLRKIGCNYQKSLEKLIDQSDAIFISLALNKNTRKIINRDLILKMNKKILVNTSRGSLVDEEAIIESLDKEILKCYLTDVTEYEPPKKTSLRLIKHSKVISTPHIGGYSESNLYNVTTKALDIVHEFS